MTWMVTGGAGYIGAHVVRALREAGRDVVVLDDLSSGHREFVPDDVPFVQGSVADAEVLRQVMQQFALTGVIHLAGFKYAGESVHRPLHTYEQNVVGTLRLLQAMAEADVERIVFSSSASVYGTPDVELVDEQTATGPQSPYGQSKLIGEWLLQDQAVATGLRHVSLRYFNVVGSGSDDLYDTSPHNLFPIVLKVLSEGGVPRINGDDYDTQDGTCVRDYVHVSDLAAAHVAAAVELEEGRSLEPVYNLGSGTGLSVRQIVDRLIAVTGADVTAEVTARRPGDPDRIVASGELAARDLDWRMRHSVDDMVRSAWQAWERSGKPAASGASAS
jgi:UDP-glucose 4-epimerase